MWKPIKDYEGLYEISDAGEIRRLPGYKCRRMRVLKASSVGRGYFSLRLFRRGVRARHVLIHRIVYSHFVGPIPAGMTINHKNGKKTDNSMSNLELATMSQQQHHAYATGLQKHAKGEARKNVAKLTNLEVLEIRRLYPPRPTYKELATRFGVSEGTILSVVHRKHWTHI